MMSEKREENRMTYKTDCNRHINCYTTNLESAKEELLRNFLSDVLKSEMTNAVKHTKIMHFLRDDPTEYSFTDSKNEYYKGMIFEME